jgi:hypothetical protein
MTKKKIFMSFQIMLNRIPSDHLEKTSMNASKKNEIYSYSFEK